MGSNMGSSNGKPVLREEDISALSKTSGLDEPTIKNSFKQFIADHPDGRMKHKDILKMMQKALPKKDASKLEKHLFRIYDSNNDGYIDFTEFMLLLLIMQDGNPEEVLTKIFRVFDVNSDGSITMAEMTKVMKDMYSLLQKEDPNLAAEHFVAKTAFAEMDKDMDGRVTCAEFVQACLVQEEFSKMLSQKVLDIFVDDDEQ